LKIKREKLELEARYPTKSTKKETDETSQDEIAQIAILSDGVEREISKIKKQYEDDPEMAQLVIKQFKRNLVEKGKLGGDDI
jgi:hypothetical protein